MSQRMWTSALAAWELKTPEDVMRETRRARSEEARLLEESRTKDEAIKSLADALWNSGEDHAEIGWHTPMCLVHGAGDGKACTNRCESQRAALRLCGRLK